MSENIFRSDCPISSSLDLFGDKWTLLIIRDLLYHGIRTFRDFAQAEEKISSARLAERLKKLEHHGIIQKRPHPSNKKVFHYSLLPKGKDLAPVVVDLIAWGNRHLHDHISATSKAFAKQLATDREGTLRQLMQ